MYFKINNNFSNFYNIVQNFNTFDLEAKELVDHIDSIKAKLNDAHILVQKDMLANQRKIQQKLKLSKLLKILETIKYVDRANSTIKGLLDKTNYKKLSELLFTLSSSLDSNLSEIAVLENKWEEVKKLKHNFIQKLISIADEKVDKLTDKAFTDFSVYIDGFDPDSDRELMLAFSTDVTEDITSIVLELKLFSKDESLYRNLISHFQSKFSKYNKNLVERISKIIAFKTPNAYLLKSYRNLINYFFTLYQSVLPVDQSTAIYSQFLQILIKNANVYLRRVLDVFELVNINIEIVREIIGVLGSFEKFGDINSKSESPFESLQIYFRKIVFNARQHRLCLEIKNAMENENWSIETIGSETEQVLKRAMPEGLSVFTQYVVYNEVRYQFTESFLQLLSDLNELEALNEELQNPGTTYSMKIKDIVELYLINCENLILHGMALNFSKIKKINTKILGRLIRSRHVADQLP